MQRFEAAPWAASLKAMSALAGTVLGAIAVVALLQPPLLPAGRFGHAIASPVAMLPWAILGVALLFVVRGYDIEGRTLWVRRLLWRTAVPLDGLESAHHDPHAMRGSRRLFGNGGLFSVTGVYRNAQLGRYRAFVTDPRQALVLRLNGRVVVVSPAHPHAMLQFLARHFPGARVEEAIVQPAATGAPKNSSLRRQ